MVAADNTRSTLTLAGAERLAAVRRSGLLDTPAEEAFDRLARLARAVTAAPIALISLLTEDRQFTKSCLGLPEPWAARREIPLAYSFCRHVVAGGQPLFLEDARQYDVRTASALDVAAYAGLPLVADSGLVIGSLCVMDRVPRAWTTEQREALGDLAAAVSNLIELHTAGRLAAAQTLERRQVELALSESEDRLRLIAYATRDVVYDVTLATGEIWWSRNLVTLFGYESGETHNLEWWQSHIHPDEQARVLAGFNRVLESTDQFWSKEYRFQRQDGVYVHLFDRGYVIRDERGRADHFVGAMADISGHRETEQAWHESETRFKQLVETATEGIWFIDANHRTTFVNQQLAEMLGCTREEMIGASFFDFMDAEDRPAAAAHLERRRQGLHEPRDFRFRRKDGSDLWALLNAGPILDVSGHPTGAYALVTDITDRRQAEFDLAQRVSHLHTLYEVSQGIAAEVDLAQVYAMAHAAVQRLMAAEAFFIALVDEERHEVEDVYLYDRGPLPPARYPLERANLTTRVLADGQPLRLDGDAAGVQALSQADLFGGGEKSRSVMLAPLKLGNKVIGVMSTQSYKPHAFTDLHEQLFQTLANQVTIAIENARLVGSLRESEGRFRQLAENIQQFFWITTSDRSTLLYASPSYEAIWGRSLESLYRDPASLIAAVHPDDRQAVTGWQAERGPSSTSLEYRILRPDGTIRWIGSQAFPVRDPDGVVYRIAGISEDITERRLIEAALARERDLLQALLDNSPDTIYFKDMHSRFTRINQSQARLLGAPNVEAALGKTDVDYFEGGLAQDFLDEEQALLRTGVPLLDRIEYNPTRDGRPRWFSATKVPLHDRQGRVVGLVGVSRDITGRKLAEIELQTQKELFENLVAVARATVSLPSLEATLQSALDVSVALTAAGRGSLFLLDHAGKVTHSLLSGAEPMTTGRRLLLDQVMKAGLAGWVAAHRESVLIADTAGDSRWIVPPDEAYGTRSALAVPINYGDVVLGILTLQHTALAHFTPAHLQLMQAAADQMALALRNARLFDDTQTLAVQMYMLNHITQAALEAGTVDDLYQAMADRVGELFNSDACHITAWDEGREAPAGKASSDGFWRDHYRDFQPLPGEATLTASVLAAGRALAVDDRFNSPYLSRRIAEQFTARSALGLPLIAHGRKLGAIILDFDNPRHFTEDEISLGERTARQVALALSNALLYREATEERSRLQALIDSSRDGVALISFDQRILICNDPTVRLLHLPGQPAEWLGKSFRAILSALRQAAPSVARVAHAEMRRIAAGDTRPGEGEFTVGKQFLHWLSLPVAAGAAVLGRLIVLRDVTGERELEALRNDLAHMMVHDLRGPLTAIVSAADVLAGRLVQVGATERELAEIIREGAERMANLVADILNVNQLETTGLPLERGPAALAPMVADVLHLQNGTLLRKNIRLTGRPAETLPRVWADPGLLSRVLQNLIGNAVKFTPVNGAIGIAAVPEGAWLTVSVTNSGPGVPAEVKDRLFNKFARGNQKEHGSGLGLAFCRMVVEAHGGRIWAESEPGQGATFRFSLPLYQPGD